MANPHEVRDYLAGELAGKYERLLAILGEMGSVLVGFSGGADSALVGYAAHQALGERALSVTAASPVELPGEAEGAARLAQALGLRHQVIEIDDLQDATFAANPVDRCYHCKLRRFGGFAEMARELDLAWLADGTNLDDGGGYRPGMRALQEIGVRSPLKEAGFSKSEVRQISQALGLPTWDKPSAPCLATRFPYDTPLTRTKVEQVGRAEVFLHGLGFRTLRVRVHGELARIEIPAGEMGRFLELRQVVLAELKGLGFANVTLDLEGFRSGGWDKDLRLGGI